jgi:hypothetical protein
MQVMTAVGSYNQKPATVSRAVVSSAVNKWKQVSRGQALGKSCIIMSIHCSTISGQVTLLMAPHSCLLSARPDALSDGSTYNLQ